MQLVALFIANERTPILRAEDEMNNNIGEGLRHKLGRPYRAWEIWGGPLPRPSAPPALSAWAITDRAFSPRFRHMPISFDPILNAAG